MYISEISLGTLFGKTNNFGKLDAVLQASIQKMKAAPSTGYGHSTIEHAAQLLQDIQDVPQKTLREAFSVSGLEYNKVRKLAADIAHFQKYKTDPNFVKSKRYKDMIANAEDIKEKANAVRNADFSHRIMNRILEGVYIASSGALLGMLAMAALDHRRKQKRQQD